MGPFGVVEADPRADDPFGLEAVGQLVQVDRLVFERAPQPFDKNIVHAAPATVHGDRGARVLERAGEVEAGELATLIGVEDIQACRIGSALRSRPRRRTGRPGCSTTARQGHIGSPNP